MKYLPNRALKFLKAFTLIELLVVISIIAILAGLAIPAIGDAMTKGQMMQTLNNGIQLQKLTMSAALDATTTGDTNIIGWPGTNNTYENWINSLTNSTLTTNVIMRLFQAPGAVPTAWPPAPGAFFVYGVSETSSSDTIFLSTRNWQVPNNASSTTPGPSIATSTTAPYAAKGFIVIRQGGDGTRYGPKQATNPMSFFGSAATNIVNP